MFAFVRAFGLLRHLLDLRLFSFPTFGMADDKGLFFSFLRSFSPSLQLLALSRTESLGYKYRAGDLHNKESGGQEDIELGQLTRLEMDCPTDFPASFLRYHFMVSPTLGALSITGYNSGGPAYAAMIESVAQFCPRLKDVSFASSQPNWPLRDTVAGIMNAVTENTLEAVRLNEFRSNKTNKMQEEALLRHSSSL
ncbi:hypothetical protein BGX23_002973 [Mortierella sp. AD031]|nr:hypothetical protein BGX23_002973 [Mortierella sp. AD031]